VHLIIGAHPLAGTLAFPRRITDKDGGLCATGYTSIALLTLGILSHGHITEVGTCSVPRLGSADILLYIYIA
jgi:hypothetical protein